MQNLFEIYWTKEAEENLESILKYYLEQSGEYLVKAIHRRVVEQVNALAYFPKRCRKGRVDGTWECVLLGLPYMVVFYVDESRVTILNMIHTARKYP